MILRNRDTNCSMRRATRDLISLRLPSGVKRDMGGRMRAKDMPLDGTMPVFMHSSMNSSAAGSRRRSSVTIRGCSSSRFYLA